jgi:hypothetical protein
MAIFNYFVARVPCPICGTVADLHFQADIGVLRLDGYNIGDVVVHDASPGEKVRIGPDPTVDWLRPFWAAGLARCPLCVKDVTARIEIRSARYTAAVIDRDLTDLFAWGYLDAP